MALKLNSPPSIICPNKCGRPLQLDDYFPGPYFSGLEMNCLFCGKDLDLWTYAVDLLAEKSKLFRNRGAAFIGGRETFFTFLLAPNETREVTLTDYGIPKDSKLIYMVYTPTVGAGWPIAMHSNELLQHKHGHKMTFYGKPFPNSDMTPSQNHNIQVQVTFIPKTADQIPFELLANAYEYFLEDNYQEMILPSAVALEDATKQLAYEVLQRIGLPENLNPSRRISFEIIIPLIAKQHSIPALNKKIISSVLKLWKLRDQMAHKGVLEDSLDLDGAAKLLAAAMFSINYFSFFRDTIHQNFQ